jgi:hypothetical protein
MNNTAINPLIQTIGYNNYSTDHHRFVLCESCFWSATIFKSDKNKNKLSIHVLFVSMTVVSH